MKITTGNFSIPYIKNITKILSKIPKNIVNDIYFSDGLYPSARNIQLNKKERDELKELSGEYNLNYTLNPSCYSNNFYLKDEYTQFLKNLELLKEYYNLKYLTFNNTIILKEKNFRQICDELQITLRLSVNNVVDSLEKLKIFVQEFKIYDIVLDRSLNRNWDELEKIIEYKNDLLKNNIELNLILLVNEGCLPNCPYKTHCDNMICQYHKYNEDEINTFSNIHDQLTCTNEFSIKPWKALQSPFISPIYLDKYKNDFNFKIAGRGKEKYILEKIILSYTNAIGEHPLKFFFSTFRSNDFNKINFYNLEEFNFFENTYNCKLNCHSCDYCEKTFKELLNGKY